MSLDSHDLIPPEPPPKAMRISGFNWARKNLFSSVFSGTLTAILTVGLLLGILAVLRFIFSPDRRWEVIPPNAANYTVGSYPRDDLGNIWWSVWVIAALAGMSTVLWGVGGRVSVVKVVAGVRAAGVTALVVGVLSLWSPAGTAVQSWLVWGGAALIVAGWVPMRLLSEDRTVATANALAALVGLGMVVLWYLHLDRTSHWHLRLIVTALVVIAFHWLGRMAKRWLPDPTFKKVVTMLWVISFPVIYMHIQRNPSVAWEEVLPWLPWAALVMAVGPVAIGLVSRLPREQAAAVNFLLGAVTIFSWVVEWPMAIRVMTLLLTLFSMAAPTFASSPQARKVFYWSWLGGSLCALYFFLLGVASTGLDTRGDFLGGFNLTILLAVGGIALSFPVGLLLALGRTSTMPIFRILSVAYIEVIRGVPLITVLFFADKVIPRFLPPWVDVIGETKALLAITAFAAAYLAENVRGGLQSVSSGQFEAARALGMTTSQMTMLVTLPQALKAVIPAMVGQAIALFKDTSLVAIIGLADFLRVARDVVPNQPDSLGSVLENLLLAAVVYWIFAFSFSRASQRLEKRLGVGTR
ncbi:MAG: amino acid ABC transporter permease [bacterium]|nr:amino acid ABC transporter permease [Acidimicrobiia bacterium]MCY4650186.1 amino acid ABC transporter permease [bacterium]